MTTEAPHQRRTVGQLSAPSGCTSVLEWPGWWHTLPEKATPSTSWWRCESLAPSATLGSTPVGTPPPPNAEPPEAAPLSSWLQGSAFRSPRLAAAPTLPQVSAPAAPHTKVSLRVRHLRSQRWRGGGCTWERLG